MSLHVLGRRADAAGVLEAWSRDAAWFARRLYAPLAIVLLVAGVLLVGEQGYEHSQAWVSIAYTGWLAAFAIAVLGYRSADPKRVLLLNNVEIAILLLLVVDMAVKPGA